MIQRSSKVFPKWSLMTGKIGREQQHNHVDEAAGARGPNPYARYQGQSDGPFTECNQKSDESGMRQHDLLKHRHKERISGALLQETVDPPLKSAAQRELRTRNLVFAEDEEQPADCNPKPGECNRIASFCSSR